MISRKIEFEICGRQVNMIALPADAYLARRNEILADNYAIFNVLGSDTHSLITREDLDTEEFIEARELPDVLFEVFVTLNTVPAAKAEARIKDLLPDARIFFEKKTK